MESWDNIPKKIKAKRTPFAYRNYVCLYARSTKLKTIGFLLKLVNNIGNSFKGKGE